MKTRLFALKLILSAFAAVTFTSSAFAQLGSVDKDLVFTPVTPCRIVDTRTTSGGTGPIQAGLVKTFNVFGVSTYAGQGGSPSNCGIDAGVDTAAVAVSMAVVYPAGQGYLTAFPGNIADVDKPLSSTMNFNASEVVVSNAAVLKVSPYFGSNLKIFASSRTEVIVDVVGYYSRPVATALNCTTVTGVQNVAGGAYAKLPLLSCAEGFTPVSQFFSTGVNILTADSYISGNTGQISVRSFSSNMEIVTANLRCCQIPGRLPLP